MRKSMGIVDTSDVQQLILDAGGYIAPGRPYLKGYFSRLADLTGLSARVIRAAWEGKRATQQTLAKLQQIRAEHEVSALAVRLEKMAEANRLASLAASLDKADQDFHEQASAHFLRMASQLRGFDRARHHGR